MFFICFVVNLNLSVLVTASCSSKLLKFATLLLLSTALNNKFWSEPSKYSGNTLAFGFVIKGGKVLPVILLGLVVTLPLFFSCLVTLSCCVSPSCSNSSLNFGSSFITSISSCLNVTCWVSFSICFNLSIFFLSISCIISTASDLLNKGASSSCNASCILSKLASTNFLTLRPLTCAANSFIICVVSPPDAATALNKSFVLEASTKAFCVFSKFILLPATVSTPAFLSLVPTAFNLISVFFNCAEISALTSNNCFAFVVFK